MKLPAEFADIAPHLANPLVLVGFVLLLFFMIHRALIRSGLLNPLPPAQKGGLVATLLRYGFIVALAIIVGGFGFATYQAHLAASPKADVGAIVETLMRRHQADLEDSQEREAEARQQVTALTAAVTALVRQGRRPEVEAALQGLARGETAAAEGVFRAIAVRSQAANRESLGDAAAAARHLGALAALRDTEEALEAYRRATTLDPASADGWLGLGDAATAAGRLAEAEQAYVRLLALSQQAQDPALEALARVRLGDVRLDQGDLPAALLHYQARMIIAERLAQEEPDNPRWQRALAVTHKRLGDAERIRGDLAATLTHYRVRMDITARLAAANPADAERQRDLALAHAVIGDVLHIQGDTAAALEHHRTRLVIAETLAAGAPSDLELQRDLGLANGMIGWVLFSQGDLAGALQYQRARLAIAETLAAVDPLNLQWQFDLSRAHSALGNVLLARGDAAGALQRFSTRVAVVERLVALDPTNTAWRRDLGRAHGQVSRALLAQAEVTAAHEHARRSLAAAEGLAAGTPMHADWQRDLVSARARMGEVLEARRDLAGALGHHRTRLAGAERLTASDPTNAVWRADLAKAHKAVGRTLRAQGDHRAAAEHFRAARALEREGASISSEPIASVPPAALAPERP